LDARVALRLYSKVLVLMLWIRRHVMYRQADTLKIVLGYHPFELGTPVELLDRASL